MVEVTGIKDSIFSTEDLSNFIAANVSKEKFFSCRDNVKDYFSLGENHSILAYNSQSMEILGALMVRKINKGHKIYYEGSTLLVKNPKVNFHLATILIKYLSDLNFPFVGASPTHEIKPIYASFGFVFHKIYRVIYVSNNAPIVKDRSARFLLKIAQRNFLKIEFGYNIIEINEEKDLNIYLNPEEKTYVNNRFIKNKNYIYKIDCIRNLEKEFYVIVVYRIDMLQNQEFHRLVSIRPSVQVSGSELMETLRYFIKVRNIFCLDYFTSSNDLFSCFRKHGFVSSMVDDVPVKLPVFSDDCNSVDFSYTIVSNLRQNYESYNFEKGDIDLDRPKRNLN